VSAIEKASKGFEINIRNEVPEADVSEKGLVKVVTKILKDLGFKKAMISILLVSGRRMRALNQRYLKHAWSTDVLAFGQKKITKTARLKQAARQGGDESFLGDIALCLPTIKDQAEEYGHSFKEELDYCLCHGILHLLGHEDKSRTGHKSMHRRQKQILKRITPGA
jgi:probable rRNA maturation factor